MSTSIQTPIEICYDIRMGHTEGVPEGVYLYKRDSNTTGGGLIMYVFEGTFVYYKRIAGFETWHTSGANLFQNYEPVYLCPNSKSSYWRLRGLEPGPDLTDCIDLI